ncbi:MAG: type II secretion system F family protein [Kiritimatiellae bacterium]|nr:type II secretion system F family protein [Kiritimatiellia bacterium]
MATFVYTAIDRSGKRTEGTIDATDKRGAQTLLERSGRIPISIKEGGAAKASSSAGAGAKWWQLAASTSTKMSQRDVMLFTEELSDLLSAGMTLGNALNSLSQDASTPSGRVAADLRDRIIRGEALSDAVRAHPESFPPLYGNMIRAGEASGALPDVLHRLIEHYERMSSMRSKIVQALTYPAIVLLLGVVTVVFAMIKIIPQFMTVFTNMRVALPPTTQLLVDISSFTQKYILVIIIAVALLAVVLSRAVKTPGGRRMFDLLKLRTPIIKGVVANGVFASFARTLQTLLANGVTVVNALKITEETVGNAIIAEELRHARERVTDGTTISGPLAASGVFPKMMTDLLAIGEQTGDMPSALGHIGRRYESEMDRHIKILTAALEPMLIFLVAGVVGFIAISILSAVFKVTSGLGAA